jgi:TolA-binding protein
MKPERHSLDDLLILARRGELSLEEDRRLRDALAGAPEMRFVFEAGRAFDVEAPVVAGDDERIALIERQVEKRLRLPGSPSARRWKRMVQLALAAVLVVGAALGGIEIARTRTPERAPAAQPTPVTSTSTSTSTATPTPTPTSTSTATATSTPTSTSTSTLSPAPASTPSKHPPTQVQPPPPNDGLDEALAQPEPAAPRGASAHDLFSAANAARVRGDVDEAITLSRLLEDRFPLSSEAKTAHLTLGMLYLQGGQAAPALQEFRQCKALGASATMPEALWGESQALRALGRYDEERAVLEELLQGFPQSAYASAATKRLADSH